MRVVHCLSKVVCSSMLSGVFWDMRQREMREREMREREGRRTCIGMEKM